MTPKSVRVTGWGMYAPERRLTNADLERVVDTSDEWIVQRTGIRERRVAAAHETTATLSAIAGKRAIAVAGLQPDDIDVILIATLTPDYWMPSTGALVKEAIGNTRAAAMDVMAACSGFVYAYSVADAYIRSGIYKNALVIGAETSLVSSTFPTARRASSSATVPGRSSCPPPRKRAAACRVSR